MKILYFYQYFSTPHGSWGTRVYDFAKRWVEQGHEVTVVSSIYNKSDLKAVRLVEDQYFEGIHVKVLNILIDNKQSVPARIWSFLKYSILSAWFALRLKADVVIASSGPITVGLPGLVAHWLQSRKMVFEVRDLWPEGAVQLGIIRSFWLKKLAYWFERKCYLNAAHIVTLSPGMEDNIRGRFGLKNVSTVTNAVNVELFGRRSDEVLPAFLENKKYVVYAGNIGPVNNSHWLLDAAAILTDKGRGDILILLIGEGIWRQELEEKAKALGLSNFLILPLMPKTRLVNFIQRAVAAIVPLKGVPVLDTSSPNKLFESMAAGIPIIQNTKGWIREFLENERIGLTIDPDDPDALAEALIFLSDNPSVAKDMGARASRYAAAYFDKNYLADKMLDVLKNVTGTASFRARQTELSAT